MQNADQKIIFIEDAYNDIEIIFTNFQDESAVTDIELNALPRDPNRVWKSIDVDCEIHWELKISIFYVVMVRDLDLNSNSYWNYYAKNFC